MEAEGILLCLIFVVVAISLGFAYYLARWVLAQDEGSEDMKRVAIPIREVSLFIILGFLPLNCRFCPAPRMLCCRFPCFFFSFTFCLLQAAVTFLTIQYTTIAKISTVVAVCVFFLYGLLPSEASHLGFNPWVIACMTVICFFLGAICSATSGILGMWISVNTNVRAAAAANISADACLKVCCYFCFSHSVFDSFFYQYLLSGVLPWWCFHWYSHCCSLALGSWGRLWIGPCFL